MSAVSETIVREFFELHGFFVRQQRKFISPLREENEEIDFMVVNSAPAEPAGPLPAVLRSADLKRVSRAIIVVLGSHAESLSIASLSNDQRIDRLASSPAAPEEGDCARILVVPDLPQNEESRRQIAEHLRGKGVDAMLPFRTVLSDLIDHAEVNRNYQKSDLLQSLRLLKRYGFFKEKQLELFRPKRPRAKAKSP